MASLSISLKLDASPPLPKIVCMQTQTCVYTYAFMKLYKLSAVKNIKSILGQNFDIIFLQDIML